MARSVSTRTGFFLVLAACLLAGGCAPKMTQEQMAQMRPERPAELDALNAWVGKWEYSGTAEMDMLEDGPLTMTGTMDTRWAGDNWYIVSNATMKMGDWEPMKGMETWTYDVHSKVYRSSWVDSMGAVGYGEGKFDAETNTWTFKATSHMPFGKSTMKGKATFVDADTIEMEWAEYMGLMKTMDMKGTSRRIGP